MGKNPTFAGDKQTLEAYILDYSGDLYNQGIELQFLAKTRTIERFSSTTALKEQIATDVVAAKELIGFRLQKPNCVRMIPGKPLLGTAWLQRSSWEVVFRKYLEVKSK